MRKKWIAGASLVPALGVVGLLAGCNRFQSSPGEVCSASATYDTLNGVLASTTAPADRSHMLDRLKALVSYKMVTVDAVDKDTGKVSCGAMLNFSGSPEGVRAIANVFALHTFAQTIGQPAGPIPIDINDQDATHVSFQVHYTVQKTQDSGQSVVMLDQARFLAQVLGRGIAESDKPAPPASSSQPPATEAGANGASSYVGSTGPDTVSDSAPAFGGASIGMAYSDFRQHLIAAGFKPIYRQHDMDCDNSKSCTHQEAVSCTDDGVCRYRFSNSDGIWEVTTRGEGDDPSVTNISQPTN